MNIQEIATSDRTHCGYFRKLEHQRTNKVKLKNKGEEEDIFYDLFFVAMILLPRI